MFKIKTTIFYALILAICFSGTAVAQNIDDSGNPVLLQEVQKVYKAKVLDVRDSRVENIPGTDTKHTYQTIDTVILDKDRAGDKITIDNDYTQLEKGDVFFMSYFKTTDGKEIYGVKDSYRLDVIWALLGSFILLVLFLGGKQGFLSLLSLVGSFGAMFYVLFPGILSGYNPVLLSGVLAVLILFLIMYMTHGFNRMTTSAFLGCFLTIAITIGLSYVVVLYAKLSGFSDEESIYLNFNTNGSINFQGLLLGAIIIGVIGIIDDIAITQASVVAELRNLNEKLSSQDIFRKAMKIGRDHTGAVVNSLVLAYTGASLPLLLLLYTSETPVLELINMDYISTEIVRTLVGSIGLVLAVPITTFVAVKLIKDKSSVKGLHTHSHSHKH